MRVLILLALIAMLLLTISIHQSTNQTCGADPTCRIEEESPQ